MYSDVACCVREIPDYDVTAKYSTEITEHADPDMRFLHCFFCESKIRYCESVFVERLENLVEQLSKLAPNTRRQTRAFD